ncbi:MAG: TrkA family potassium uptake protein [Clostridia bacterium]|nr:TrkA family potassium uptake protein [Clostridia bacterium]
MLVVIIGGGRVGYYLAKNLLQQGHGVVLVEKNKERCMNLQNELGEIIVWGNGANTKVLTEARCTEADVVVVATREDDDNLVVAQMVKNQFNVPKVISRINNPCNERIFHELGISTTVSSISVIAELIHREVMSDQIKGVLSYLPEELKLREMVIDSRSPGSGKQVKDLDLPESCLLTAIIREGKVVVPQGEHHLVPGDRIIALYANEAVEL